MELERNRDQYLSSVEGPSKVVRWLTGGAICATAVFVATKFLQRGRRPRLDLSGKTVLVTGGSRGLGLALSREFGSRGARVALCARDQRELDEGVRRLGADGIRAAGFRADITDASAIEPLVQQVIEHFGSIDILINNAGKISVGPVDCFTRADFEDAMNLMFWAPFNLTVAVLPHMTRQGGGHIVNITSVGGRASVPHLLPYSCAKFAFVALSSGLSVELNSKGVHVLTVVPGLMRTGSYLNAEFRGAPREEFAWFGILGNMPGLTVAAKDAAEEIRLALEREDHIHTIGLPAKLLTATEALAPEITREIFTFVNETLLPASSADTIGHKGKLITPPLNALFQRLTALGKSAAADLNE